MAFLLGGMTCVVMEHFEASAALAAIETYRVTTFPVGADHVHPDVEAR